MRLLLVLFAAVLYPAYGDNSLGSSSTYSTDSYNYQYKVQCPVSYSSNCPVTVTPGYQYSNFGFTINSGAGAGEYYVPLGAEINSATLSYQAYEYSYTDNQYYDAYFNSFGCNGCGNVPLLHSFSSYVGSITSGASSAYAGNGSGSINLLADGFGSALANNDPISVSGTNFAEAYNYYTWYGSGDFEYIQDNSLAADFYAYANLSLSYTPDPGATVNAGSTITATYGDTIALDGTASHPFGYSYSDGWSFSNGDTASGLTPTIDLTGPSWAPGDYTLTLQATDQYGYKTDSVTHLDVLAPIPEPSAVILLATLIAWVGFKFYRPLASR